MGQRGWFQHTNDSLTIKEYFSKNAYLLFGWHKEFFDHHAVPGIGASVQGVGPIRTEGAEAVVVTVTHSRVVDGDEMNKRKLMHATLRTGTMAKKNQQNLFLKRHHPKWKPFCLRKSLKLGQSHHQVLFKIRPIGVKSVRRWNAYKFWMSHSNSWPTGQLRRTGWLQMIWLPERFFYGKTSH